MAQPTLFDEPLARLSDPETAHEAAERLIPGNSELIRRIRIYVSLHGPCSAFDVADAVDRAQPGRWDESTIRSAVSRSHLGIAKIHGLSPRGQRCQLYVLHTEETKPL